MVEQTDRVQRRVELAVYGMVVDAYGLPGHLRHAEPEDVPCDGCGHMMGDHCTGERGCTYCDCPVKDLS